MSTDSPATTAREYDIDWRPAVRDVVWIPAAYREATMSRAEARRTLRCTEASFAQLLDLGLPSDDGSDGPRFDATDLKNVGLYSRSRVTDVEVGMRLILAFMRASRDELLKPRRWRYRLRLRGDDTGAHAGGEAGGGGRRQVYRPMPELFGGKLDSYEAEVGPLPQLDGAFFRMASGSEVVGGLTTRGIERTLRSGEVRRIVTDFLDSGIRWHALPPGFTADPWEPIRRGAGNCRALCAVLAQQLHDAGFDVRAFHGWMASISELDHGWVEVVDDDGKVKYLDPSFALLATGNGFGTHEFRELVIGSIVNRVVPTQAPVDHAYVVDGTDSDVVTFEIRADNTPADDGKRGGGLLRRRT